MPLTKVASSMLASGTSGSGGSAGKNYISSYNGNSCNGDFESGSISGWNVCSVTGFTNGVPNSAATIISSPGVSDPALSLLSSGQLAGQFSLQTVFPTTAVNEGFISDIFTIDAEDQAKVLTFKFYYNLSSSSGTVNFSGTSSNAFLVAIYDQTNLAWIQPAGLYSMTQSSGTGIATGTFQTTSNSTQYRFAIFCASVTGWTGSATLKFDDFSVGPQTAPIGPVATDWINYTPTGSWTANTTYTGKYRRVGDSIEIQGRVLCSAAPTPAGVLSVNLPTGLSIDTNKINLATQPSVFGSVMALDNGVQTYAGTVSYNTATSVRFILGTNGTIQSSAPFAFGASDEVDFMCVLPIAGLSANVQMSNDTDTRVVAASGYFNAVSLTGSESQFSITSVSDSHAAFTSNSYVVPVSGYYQISAYYIGNTSSATLNNSSLRCKVGGVLDKQSDNYGSFVHTPVLSYVRFLNAGNILTFFGSTDGGPTLPVSGTSSTSGVSIQRLSGPSVIAATETVACRYTNIAGTSIGTSTAQIPFATKSYDTHNAFNGTTFTVPVSGKYLITAKIGAVVTSSAISLEIRKGGTRISFMRSPGTVSDTMVTISDQLDLIAGDVIDFAGNIANASTLITAVGFNHITIVRVGN